MADITERSGGAELKGKKIKIGQDVVGRDKIVQNITQQAAPVEKHDSLPNQPYFFGRKDELAKITDALDPGAQGWGVLISGPGGIGKTALAVRAGHLAPEEYFPIKIFLSAKVIQLTPQGVEDLQDFMLPNYMTLLAELARELGDENIAKIDPNLRANEVRRMLAEKQALIIIDNLETFDEKTERPRVFQFLSRLPRSCKAIVTSRRRIDTPAEIIRLDKLERDDALKLIESIAKRNRHVAKTTETERIGLYEITHGHPLLIEWVAGQLGNSQSHCRTLTEACQFLENAPKDNDPLEFVFGDLLDTFTEHETAVLAALTYFTEPARVKWIVEIAEITITQAETALEDLADRSVLAVGEMPNLARGSASSDNLRDQPSQGYLLPSLTATFLRHARPEVIAKAGSSLSDRAYALAQENGWYEYDRFPTLEAEWPTIAAAIPLMLQGDNDRLQRLCSALVVYMNFSGRWDERLSLNLQAEEKALAANDAPSAGWNAYWAGKIYSMRGQSAEVLACAARAEKHWTKAGVRMRAGAIRLRAKGQELAKDHSAAHVTLQQSIVLLNTQSPVVLDEIAIEKMLAMTPIQSQLGVRSRLNDFAEVEANSGDYFATERDYREKLLVYETELINAGIWADFFSVMASLLAVQERWEEAEQLARRELTLAEGVGWLELIASNCASLAKVYARQGRKAEGLPYAQRAVAIYTKLRWKDLAAAQAVLKECEEGAKQQIDNE